MRRPNFMMFASLLFVFLLALIVEPIIGFQLPVATYLVPQARLVQNVCFRVGGHRACGPQICGKSVICHGRGGLHRFYRLACLASPDEDAAPEKDAEQPLDLREILRSRSVHDLDRLQNRMHFGQFLRAYTTEAEKLVAPAPRFCVYAPPSLICRIILQGLRWCRICDPLVGTHERDQDRT
jgi:hypothetical protein